MHALVGTTPLKQTLTTACPRCQVRVRGTVRLPSGDVNLVATQLALDREHANLINFQAEQGLDPVVDLVMSGGDLRVAIQARGRVGSCTRCHVQQELGGGGSAPWLHAMLLVAFSALVACCGLKADGSARRCTCHYQLATGPLAPSPPACAGARQRVAGPPDAALRVVRQGAP